MCIRNNLNFNVFFDRDATHADWVKAWLATLTELQAFVKEHYTTGVQWNKKVNNGSVFRNLMIYLSSLLLVYSQLIHVCTSKAGMLLVLMYS